MSLPCKYGWRNLARKTVEQARKVIAMAMMPADQEMFALFIQRNMPQEVVERMQAMEAKDPDGFWTKVDMVMPLVVSAVGMIVPVTMMVEQVVLADYVDNRQIGGELTVLVKPVVVEEGE